MKKSLMFIPFATILTALSGCQAIVGEKHPHLESIKTNGYQATLRVPKDVRRSIDDWKFALFTSGNKLGRYEVFEVGSVPSYKVMQYLKANFTNQNTLQFELGFYLDTGLSEYGRANYKVNYSVSCQSKELFDECNIQALSPIYKEHERVGVTKRYLEDGQYNEGILLNKVLPLKLITTYESQAVHGIKTIKDRLASQQINFSMDRDGYIKFSIPDRKNMVVTVVMSLHNSLIEASIEMRPTLKGPSVYDYYAEHVEVKKIIDEITK